MRVATDSRRRLPDYFAITEGKKEAGYLRCRKVMLSADLENDEDERLWRLHGQVSRDGIKFESIPAGSAVNLLDLKAALAGRIMDACCLCERACLADRRGGKKGACGVLAPRLASEFIHHGEEPELVPSHTVFFSGCTFRCVFCQNWDISQFPEAGIEITPRRMAELIERRSARNVNWVGGEPTPNLGFILNVMTMISKNTPQVWNSNMYMSREAMELLDGVIDLYLSDFKYGNDSCAGRLSGVKDYWRVVTRNHLEANRQCEMIIRHLVMPGHTECCSKPVLEWIAKNLDTGKVLVNIMDQYRPEYKAHEHPDIDRRLKIGEYRSVVKCAEELGLEMTE
jgi:putative pyruvate formate lyase activating enzyme